MEQVLIANSILVWLVLVFNLLLTFALIRRLNNLSESGLGKERKSLDVGAKAPYFTAITLSGEKVTLDDYAQRRMVFVFVSPTCPPCKEKIPVLESLQPGAAQMGFEFVLVSIGDIDDSRRMIREVGADLPTIVTSHNSSFYRDYKVIGTPSYCIINQQGEVIGAGGFDENWDGFSQKWKATSVSGAEHQQLVASLR